MRPPRARILDENRCNQDVAGPEFAFPSGSGPPALPVSRTRSGPQSLAPARRKAAVALILFQFRILALEPGTEFRAILLGLRTALPTSVLDSP